MRTFVPILSLAGCTVIIAGLIVARATMSEGFNEMQIAFAYSCGYRNGQIGITSRLPSLFTNPKDAACRPGDVCDCATEKALAAKYGFIE